MAKKETEPKTNNNEQVAPVSADTLAPGSDEDKQIQEIQHELKTLTDTNSELKDQLANALELQEQAVEKEMRVRADIDNYRKRLERDIENTEKYASQKLIESLLPVIDSIEAALDTAKDENAMKQGLNMTLKIFLDVMKRYHVHPVETEGKLFDPKVHEAMTTIEQKDAKSGTIVQVIQKGYMFHDRLLRPARVIIAK